MKKFLSLILAALMLLSLLAGCGGNTNANGNADKNGNSNADNTDDGDNGDVTIVKIGIGTDAMPNCYLDENGNLAGENYEVMCLVDELLPQYEFQYETGTQEAILIGLDTGTYAVGMNNFFYNDQAIIDAQ